MDELGRKEKKRKKIQKLFWSIHSVNLRIVNGMAMTVIFHPD